MTSPGTLERTGTANAANDIAMDADTRDALLRCTAELLAVPVEICPFAHCRRGARCRMSDPVPPAYPPWCLDALSDQQRAVFDRLFSSVETAWRLIMLALPATAFADPQEREAHDAAVEIAATVISDCRENRAAARAWVRYWRIVRPPRVEDAQGTAAGRAARNARPDGQRQDLRRAGT